MLITFEKLEIKMEKNGTIYSNIKQNETST